MSSSKKHFNKIAADYDKYKKKNKYYYDNLKALLRGIIKSKSKVLEVGCGTGDLIVSVNPSKGYGTDISSEMIKIAGKKYKSKKNIKFSKKQEINFKNINFDYIFMSDVVEHLEDPRKKFREISKTMSKKTIFINTYANPIWEPVLLIAEKLGFKMPEGIHERISYKEMQRLYRSAGLKVIKHDYTLLIPVKLLGISDIINRNFSRILKRICFIEYVVAKKK